MAWKRKICMMMRYKVCNTLYIQKNSGIAVPLFLYVIFQDFTILPCWLQIRLRSRVCRGNNYSFSLQKRRHINRHTHRCTIFLEILRVKQHPLTYTLREFFTKHINDLCVLYTSLRYWFLLDYTSIYRSPQNLFCPIYRSPQNVWLWTNRHFLYLK